MNYELHLIDIPVQQTKSPLLREVKEMFLIGCSRTKAKRIAFH
jgi:hypothetical protein